MELAVVWVRTRFLRIGGSLKTQKGFTLVEIAIVLVIIGLLLGGVLSCASAHRRKAAPEVEPETALSA